MDWRNGLTELKRLEKLKKIERIKKFVTGRRFSKAADVLSEFDFEEIREHGESKTFATIYYQRALIHQSKDRIERAIKDLEKAKKFSNLSNEQQTLFQNRLTAIQKSRNLKIFDSFISSIEDLFKKNFSEIDLLDECEKRWHLDKPKRPLNILHISEYSCIGAYRWVGDPKRRQLISQLVRKLKLGDRYVAEMIAFLLKTHVKKTQSCRNWIAEVDYLIPVPSDPQRTAERQLDITDEITDHLHHLIGIPYLNDILKRESGSTHSKDTGKIQLKRQFLIPPNKASKIQGKVILLIDDVVTRGNTSSACAVHLKNHGCLKVYLLTFAQSESSKVTNEFT